MDTAGKTAAGGRAGRRTEARRSARQFMVGAALFLAGIPLSVINGCFDLLCSRSWSASA